MADRPTRIHPSAEVEPGVRVGPGSSVWHLAHLRSGAVVGADCNLGRGVYVDGGVVIGDRVKVQNFALLYEPARIGDGVFIGPAVVLTNDRYPRAVTPDGTPKTAADWSAVGVTLAEGCSLGARSVVVPGVTVGAWAMVAAGAVVTRDVPAHALVVGVPARRVGWVGRTGRPLTDAGDGRWVGPDAGDRYVESATGLRSL